eukprot:GDKJ01055441.1.p1 GENE.GDKJ01055441.1~~GDKJ01055441.1.p1  ORF type:complete len:177 (-),score=26.13 GDKJ01055441.1:116-646(-)
MISLRFSVLPRASSVFLRFSSRSFSEFEVLKSQRRTLSEKSPKELSLSEEPKLNKEVIPGSGSDKIGITDRAAAKILKIAKASKKDPVLRLGITSGGCSGFQYDFGLTSTFDPESDYITETEVGSKLVIEKSLADMFVSHAKVDYVDEMIRSGFAVTQNDAAASGCSCGKSFDPKM